MEDRVVTMPDIHLIKRTHNNSGFVSLTTLPAALGMKIVNGVLIEATRVEVTGMTKQYLWLTDETLAALISIIGDYMKARGES